MRLRPHHFIFNNRNPIIFFNFPKLRAACCPPQGFRSLTYAMSRRPNFQGGRRGGGGRSNNGDARGRGGRGEQRWWDPVWRAERLRHIAAEVEVFNEAEWLNALDRFIKEERIEMVIKRVFNRESQEALNQMAANRHLHFHAYNKGKTLVVSKVPLPNYRADLDERHGSSQKEIRMSTETERRVDNLLRDAITDQSTPSSSSGIEHSSTNSKQAKPEIDSKTKGTKELSLLLKKKQDEAKDSNMRAFREKLPAFSVRSEFLKAVKQNQIIVISGETGCGKTTQLPQLILEDEIANLRGGECSIICTQPRRISAISVAARISSERGEELGGTVGYQIRLESKRSDQTRLLFCTTGVLLRQLVQDRELRGITHLLVDEIHERGMNEDFLLIILRDLLPRRPDLRLVLMSATINAELFSNYFGNAPILRIPGRTFPVSVFFLEDVLEKTRYNIQPDADGYSGNSRRRRRRENDSKKDPLVELFEDIDIASEYRNYSPSTRQSLEAWSGSQLDLGLVEATVEHICRQEPAGAILVFLTGWDEISKLLDKIKANAHLSDQTKFSVLPLHGSMPTINQREIFDRPPTGKRKIILATNIAESSITIDDVVYVVECGKAKETSYDALNKLACLLPSWISKASAHQRRGRAGRVQPGVCFRLYPKAIHDSMLEYQLPEILRTPLQELCLQIKSLQFGGTASFLSKALQPPDPLAVQNAIELLKTIGALDDSEELTPLGRHLCSLPLDPNIGKMLLMGCVFQCLSPALTIAAGLGNRDPFVLPVDRKEEADVAKRSFAGDSCSDHIALVRAFEGYKEAKRRRTERAFCWENFLSPVTLRLMEDMREQFLTLLADLGFVDKRKDAREYNRYSDDLEMVSAVLCAGMYPNVVQCKRRGKRTVLYSKEVGKVDIHPSSVNAGVFWFPLPYLIYSEKVKTSSVYVRDSTNISDYALLLFAGSLTRGGNGEGIQMLGGYLHFSASKSVLDLITKVRGELDKLLKRKIEDPSLDLSSEGKAIVTAVVELLNSQSR